MLLNTAKIKDVYNFILTSKLDHLKPKNENEEEEKNIPKHQSEFINNLLNWNLCSQSSLAYHKIVDKRNFIYKKTTLSPDAKLISLLDSDRTLFIYEIEKWKCIFQINGKFIEPNNIRFSFDSKLFCFFDSQSNEVNVWDLEKKKTIRILKENHKNFTFATFSKDNKVLGIISNDIIKFFSFHDKGKNIFFNDIREIPDATSMEFGLKNFNLVAIAQEQIIQIWDIEKSTLVAKYEGDPETKIVSLKFIPDNDYQILVGTRNNLIFIWEWEENNHIEKKDYESKIKFKIKEPDFDIRSAHIYSENETFYIFCSVGNKNSTFTKCFLIKFNKKHNFISGGFNSEDYLIQEFPPYVQISSEFIFNNSIFISSYDCLLCEINIHTNKVTFKNNSFYGKKGGIFTSSPNEEFLCRSIPSTNFIRIFNIFNEKEKPKEISLGSPKSILSAAFSLDNLHLALSFKEEFCIYNISNGENHFSKKNLSYSIMKNYAKNKWIVGKSDGEISLIITAQGSIDFKPIILQNSKEGRKINLISLNSLDPFRVKYFISGDDAGNIILWDLKENKQIGEIQNYTESSGGKVVNAKFLNFNNECIIGNNKAVFKKCNIQKIHEQVGFHFILEEDICDFDIDSDEKNLAVSLKDGFIVVYDLKNHKQLNKYKFFNKENRLQIQISFIEQNLLAKTVDMVKKVNLSPEKSQIENVESLIYVTKRNLAISMFKNEFKFRDINSSKEIVFGQSDLKNDSSAKDESKIIQKYFISSDQTKLVGYSPYLFIVHDLIEKKENIFSNNFPKQKNDFLTAYDKTNSNTTLIVDLEGFIFIWKEVDKNPFQEKNKILVKEDSELKKALKTATNIDVSFNDQKVLIESENQKIYLFNRKNWEFIKIPKILIHKPNTIIYFSRFSSNSNNIFSILIENNNYHIKEWDEQGNNISEIKAHSQINKMIITEHNDLFLLNSHNFLEFFSTKNKSSHHLTEYYDKVVDNFFYFDKKLILYVTEKSLENKDENDDEEGRLAKKGTIEIYNDFFNNSSFFQDKKNILISLFGHKNITQKSIETSVFPFNYNFLQVMAYHQKFAPFYDQIFEALKNNKITISFKVFFQRDIHFRNCFDIAFLNKDTILFKHLLRFIMKNFKIQEITSRYREYLNAQFFERIFIMFEKTKIINKFLEFVYTEPIQFPKGYLHKRFEKPIFKILNEPFLTEEKLRIFLNEERKIGWFSTPKNDLLETVSARCFYAHEILDNTNVHTQKIFKIVSNFDRTNPIFENEAIINILEYKWNTYGKKKFFLDFLEFFIFLAIYIINADCFFVQRLTNENENVSFIVFSTLFDFIIMGFLIKYIKKEISQLLYLGYKDYFVSFWNFNDIAYICISVIATFLDFFSCYEVFTYNELLKIMHAFAIFCAFFRLLSFARGIEESSFMIKLIIEVIIDIRYFLLIMIAFIFNLEFSSNFLIITQILIFFSVCFTK